jgi:hypothetical protein
MSDECWEDTEHCQLCMKDVEDPNDPCKTNSCSLCRNTIVCLDCEFVVPDLADLHDVRLLQEDQRIADFKAGEKLCLMCAVHPRLCTEMQLMRFRRFEFLCRYEANIVTNTCLPFELSVFWGTSNIPNSSHPIADCRYEVLG